MGLSSLDQNDANRVFEIVRASPILNPVLSGWSTIALPNCWLSGSAVAQTVWNASFGLPLEHGIADIDLVYYEPMDLSASSENQHAERIAHSFPDFVNRIDVKNQARVHHWYCGKYGYSIESYRSVEHAISTFPTTSAAVGIRPDKDGLSIFAPFGLEICCIARYGPINPRSLRKSTIRRCHDGEPSGLC